MQAVGRYLSFLPTLRARWSSWTKPLWDHYRARVRLPRPAWLCLEEEAESLKYYRQAQGPAHKAKIDLPKGESAEQKQQHLSNHLANYQGDLIGVIAPQEQCFYQELTLALSDPMAIEQVLPFQLEHILPFSSQEAMWAFSIYPLDGGLSRLFVSCMRRQTLLAQQESLRKKGLELDALLSPAFAVHLAHLKSEHKARACLYIWLKPAMLTFFFVDSSGIRGVRDEELDTQTLTLERLQQELRKTQAYLQIPAGCERCLIGSLDGLQEFIEAFDTPRMIETVSLEDRVFFMTRAMAVFAESSQATRLLFSARGAVFSIGGWKKYAPALNYLQQRLAIFAIACAFVASISLSRASSHIRQTSDQLSVLAQDLGIDLSDPSSSEDTLAWVQEVGGRLDQQLSLYPLLPNLPTARDTLAWVNQQVAQVPSAKLVCFEYATQTHPDPKHPTIKYRVKVELELDIADLTSADLVQQNFLHAYAWIEKPSTLTWKAQKDRYKVTFYLKDRTSYAL